MDFDIEIGSFILIIVVKTMSIQTAGIEHINVGLAQRNQKPYF